MLHYVNSEFGFSITFPQSWENYRVFDSKEFVDTDLRVRVFYFCLPSKSRGWRSPLVDPPYAVMFSLYVFTGESWAVYASRYGDSPKGGRLLGKSDKNFFVLNYPSMLPPDLYQYMKGIDEVAKSFALAGK